MQALLIGGGSALGKAVLRQWQSDSSDRQLWSITRDCEARDDGRLHLRATDHSQDSMAALCEEIVAAGGAPERVVIALGTLHGDGYGPEKSLERLSLEALQHVFTVNCALPLLWLAALAPHLRRVDDCRIAVLSARVGSIGDNRLGGWYSYRSAKAALNMGLKSAAVEFARRAQGVKLIAYHPGTVDTPLSEPFQARVPAEKLFTPSRAATCLINVMEGLAADGELAYVDWAGEAIPW
jgi:NAD(P)-dependent dehydrogenase (short-subunit alcohol dehydrogenase family)